MFNRILVVCTGNICRSPIVEGWLKTKLPGKIVESAGTGALVGEGADPDSVAVAADHGIDLTRHRARQLTGQLLREADLVLALDRTHADWINRQFPEMRGKVHLLGKWSNNSDVPDPYRLPRAMFEHTWDLTTAYGEQWLKKF